MQTIQGYMEDRKKSAQLAIKRLRGNRMKLIVLKSQCEKLANVYAEDGAWHTAHCIRTIDIPIVEEAIKATE